MFSCLKEFKLSLIAYFHDYVFHIMLIHSHHSCFLMILNSWVWYMLHRSWVLDIMWISCVSWKIFLFYSLLEGFRTSLVIFHLTSSYSSIGRVFQTFYIFKTYFWKPLPSKGGWMGDHTHVCFQFNLHKNTIWVYKEMSKLIPIERIQWYQLKQQ